MKRISQKNIRHNLSGGYAAKRLMNAADTKAVLSAWHRLSKVCDKMNRRGRKSPHHAALGYVIGISVSHMLNNLINLKFLDRPTVRKFLKNKRRTKK